MLAWLSVVGLSLAWNIDQAAQTRSDLALKTARVLFEQLVLTRHWNASHGGVYTPVTRATQPNPYLDDELRDIRVSDSLTLTKVNPAYMTRQLAEMAAEGSGVQFHITSLDPIRPANAALPWEVDALRGFERGEPEFKQELSSSQGMVFRYMAPLLTKEACLECHGEQGYEIGDIRGGISVTLPPLAPLPLAGLIGSHLMVAAAGLAAILALSWLLKRAYDELRRQAVMDALTSIPNRRFFIEQLMLELRRGAREQLPLSLIICDIDYFKQYNDYYGHPGGDRCLRAVADVLSAGLRRGGDFCARYGGEEFVVVLPNTRLDGACEVAEQLRSSIEHLRIQHATAPAGVVTISAGVATALGPQEHERLIRNADEALYRAKTAGRNRVEAYQVTEAATRQRSARQAPRLDGPAIPAGTAG
jgi:diguanylate cyclase (GGDEF)-like protein